MAYKTFFAVDLGASSGRTMLGTLADGHIEQRELTRFANEIIEYKGRFFWDIYALYNEIVKALRLCASEGISIDSIGIDTWGVDFVRFDRDAMPVANPRCYRDPYTETTMEKVFASIPKRELYGKTGVQFMNFNSLFQMYEQVKEGAFDAARVDKVLFMPDALTYMLTGEAVCEHTILSTSQMQDAAHGGKADADLCRFVGLKPEQLGRYAQPGQLAGRLSADVQRQTGLGAVPVFCVAGHDTASAVAAVPAADEKFAYLSCGTWSLLGIETPQPILTSQAYERNFTNEGGVFGTIRFLKNICGLWLLTRCQEEWRDAPKDVARLIEEAMAAPSCGSLLNPDDVRFANPNSMTKAIEEYCMATGQTVPQGYAQTTRCIFESLANRYREVLEMLREMAPFEIERLHVIGGGSLNAPLMQMTADAIGLPVIAGPAESTALGNMMMQAYGLGLVRSHKEIRAIVAASVETKRYEPTR